MPTRARVIKDVPVAPLPRCVIDATREMRDLDQVRALMMESIQARHLTIAHLQLELEGGAIAWSARARRVMRELIAGAHSVPENGFIGLCAGSAILPPAHHNCALLSLDGKLLAITDAYIKKAGIAGEVQSLEHHLDSAAQDADMARRSTLGGRDVITFEIRPRMLPVQGAKLLADMEASYVERVARGVEPTVLLRCRPECPQIAETDVSPKTPPKAD